MAAATVPELRRHAPEFGPAAASDRNELPALNDDRRWAPARPGRGTVLDRGRARGVIIAFMAKQTTVTVTDDLDGSANAKEVTFSLNGESWAIDLSAKNRKALEKALKPYIAKATKQRRGRSEPASRKTAVRGPRKDLAAVREWAQSNGHQVSDRGRISAAVQEAYDAAH
jgi:hypothetical protein